MSDQETQLLHEMIRHPDDPEPRLIYADWLEERGDQRGEYLRLQTAFATKEESDPERRRSKQRLKALREQIDTAWLMAVETADIENCPASETASETVEIKYACPKKWSQLQSTDDETVRFCDECNRHVYHCESVAEAKRYALFGGCVAIDPLEDRQPDDLAQDFAGFLGMMDVPERYSWFAKYEEPLRPHLPERRRRRRRRRRRSGTGYRRHS